MPAIPSTPTPSHRYSQYTGTHSSIVISHGKVLKDGATVLVDGYSLTPAAVITVAKHKGKATLVDTAEVRHRIDQSVNILNEHLKNGVTIYGVNTGFGGSADVRCAPDEMHALQRGFLQHQHAGVLPTPSINGTLDLSTADGPAPLKEVWVRAAMLIRANSVARGHSAVRASTIKALLNLLHHDIVPIIPSRGSISASGDLSPLSYIAGVLEGNKNLYCWAGLPHCRRVVTAAEALSSINAEPVVFQPKEALGLVNGTAISCAAATLTLNSMHNIFALSQLLTAMNVEAVLGTAGSFAPFISEIRPHPGQTQVASTILSALEGSRLATPIHGTHEHTLFQDRYSLRTVPQWLGPHLEDMLLAHEQLTIEMNSTTDNPLIDPETGDIHHGGNFQAVSVSGAMEKCRLAAAAIGRMLFAQTTELINHATNRGLPPNLCADDPSISFTMKGIDIAMAAYTSELGFLANPVQTHVVSAEMGNQGLNSLALISARYTDTAVDLLRMMCASSLYAVCQALDLRAMQNIFHAGLKTMLERELDVAFGAHLNEALLTEAKTSVWKHVKKDLDKTTALNVAERFEVVMRGAKLPLLDALSNSGTEHTFPLQTLQDWCRNVTTQAMTLYTVTRDGYFLHGDATEVLGRASKLLYQFVRRTLNVPMNRGVIDHPIAKTAESVIVNGEGGGQANGQANGQLNGQSDGQSNGQSNGNAGDDGWRKKTVGHYVSVIYEALKSEDIMDVVVECLDT